MYLQRHGLCSFNFEQQIELGVVDDVMAFAHALSCNGLQLTFAFVTLVSWTKTKKSTIAKIDTNLIVILDDLMCVCGKWWEY